MPETEDERLQLWGIETDVNADPVGLESPDGRSDVSDDTKSSISGSNYPVTSSFWTLPSDVSWPDGRGMGEYLQNDFRNLRFKLIPAVTEGPWVVRTAVPTKPAMLGKKVVQRYFSGPGYIETDVHVGSSIIASKIVGICRGYAKNFSADVGIVLQADHESELPEKLLGCVSINHIDPEIRRKLD